KLGKTIFDIADNLIAAFLIGEIPSETADVLLEYFIGSFLNRDYPAMKVYIDDLFHVRLFGGWRLKLDFSCFRVVRCSCWPGRGRRWPARSRWLPARRRRPPLLVSGRNICGVAPSCFLPNGR